MGKFDFSIPKEFLAQLGKLEKIDPIAEKMIDESMPIIESKLIRELAWHTDTGEMQASVKNTKAKKITKGGFFAVSRPTGEDEKGVRNMEKLAYLEYGTSKQAATPILTTVLNDSESSVLSKMQEVFEREVGK